MRIGTAGSADKCRWVCDELGFDACIDYRQHPDLKSLSAALKEACPQGIDGYFENVGGLILDREEAGGTVGQSIGDPEVPPHDMGGLGLGRARGEEDPIAQGSEIGGRGSCGISDQVMCR